MDPNTQIGGPRSFPPTRWSLLKEASASDGRASLDELARVYWRPVYLYVRRKWRKSNEEAKDITQDFFLALADPDMLQRLAPTQGRFRSYVMGALDNMVRMEYRRIFAQKRGGGALHFTIDPNIDSPPDDGDTPERAFQREWATSIFQEALQGLERELRETGDTTAWELFLAYDLERPPDTEVRYEDLANRYGRSVTDVRNQLYRVRRRLRELVTERVRETVTDELALEEEMRDLFADLR